MHYCDLLRSAAVYTMSAWKAKGGHNESYNFPRSPIKALKWPYSLGWVCDINTICLPLYCSVRGGQCLCDRQRGCRAQPSLDQLSPAQLDPASANPSSPPLNHHAANKGRQQYITGMWQALAIMILKSPLGLWGKAWAHDTLAYRGNNIWKCIVAPDRGEERGDEGVELRLFRGETRRKWLWQWPLPIGYQCGLKQILHSMMGLILDTSLSKQAILQAISYVNTPISVLSCSHAAELLWLYGLGTGHVRYSAANHRHTAWHRDKPAAWELNEQIQ